MAAATLVQFNVFRKNSADVVQQDVRRLSRKCSVMALNEVRGGMPPAKGVADAVRELRPWTQRTTRAGDNRILWDGDVWEDDGFHGNRKVAQSASQWGVPAKANPSRWLMWQGLRHRRTGSRHLIYCTHLVAGFTTPEGVRDRVDEYKDDAAMHHLLWLVSLTARHMLEHPEYEHQHLLGDLNAQQRKEELWWYPARILDGLYVPDRLPKSIDWMLHSHRAAANGLKVRKRWTLGKANGLHSDHRAHLKTVVF